MQFKQSLTEMPEINSSKHTILSDVEITGSLTFRGELTFDGKLKKGTLEGESLIVGKNATIRGNIRVARLNMLGAVTGDVAVSEKCEIGESADFTGSLTTVKLAMAEGASVNGQVQIGPPQRNPKNPA
jgi:cytoskeletal protein CcmA (bactofilin family)